MEGSTVGILLLLIFLIGYGVEAGADHEIQKNLQKQQPYRTAFHFQPPKNWMNGMSLISQSYLYSAFQVYSFAFALIYVLIFWFLLMLILTLVLVEPVID